MKDENYYLECNNIRLNNLYYSISNVFTTENKHFLVVTELFQYLFRVIYTFISTHIGTAHNYLNFTP